MQDKRHIEFCRTRCRLHRGEAVLEQPRGRRVEGQPAHSARVPLQQGHRDYEQEVRHQDPLGEAEQRGNDIVKQNLKIKEDM